MQFREEIGRDQFIEALDLPDVRVQVRRARPSNLGKALTLALEEEAFLQLECNKGFLPQKVVASASQQNTSVSQQSTLVNEEMEKKLKQIEQTLGELKAVLTSQNKCKTGPRKFPFACWECKQVGHRKAECPTLVVTKTAQSHPQQENDSGLDKGSLPSPQ